MPNQQELARDLDVLWSNLGGSTSGAISGDMYLYWGQEPNDYNHIHIFQQGTQYNIKCNNDYGPSRRLFDINEQQNMNDFIQELQDNWNQECPEYIESYNSGTDLQQHKEFKKQQRQQQRQQKKQQEQQQYNQYQQSQ